MHIESIDINSSLFPTKDYYPFHLPYFNNNIRIDLETPVTFFAGENGSGKSTVLKAIAKACGIHIWQNEERSRPAYSPYEESLHNFICANWNDKPVPGSYFGSDIFTHFTEILDAWAASDPGQLDYFGGHSLTTVSHGQSLMAFFRNRYKIKGVYFLDEPETALSPRTQIELLNYLNEISRQGHAQFIIASHSPIILSCNNAVIYSFDYNPIRKVNYNNTEQYKTYRDFLMKQS